MNITDKAKALRKNQTDAEQKIWQALRNRNFLGLKFKRQYPIAPYIVDFICIEKSIILELDGGQHNQTSQIAYDRQRSGCLEQQGFKIIRIWNNEIFNNFEGVMEFLANEIQNVPPSP